MYILRCLNKTLLVNTCTIFHIITFQNSFMKDSSMLELSPWPRRDTMKLYYRFYNYGKVSTLLSLEYLYVYLCLSLCAFSSITWMGIQLNIPSSQLHYFKTDIYSSSILIVKLIIWTLPQPVLLLKQAFIHSLTRKCYISII